MFSSLYTRIFTKHFEICQNQRRALCFCAHFTESLGALPPPPRSKEDLLAEIERIQAELLRLRAIDILFGHALQPNPFKAFGF